MCKKNAHVGFRKSFYKGTFMSKYKFNNYKVEDAIKTLCEELGIDDLDRCIEMSLRHGLNVFCQVDGKTVLEFSSSLVNPVAFDPNGWNDGDVIPPPSQPDCLTSRVMLIEAKDCSLKRGFYNHHKQHWEDTLDGNVIECSRYRLYPY